MLYRQITIVKLGVSPDTNDDYDNTINTTGYIEIGGTADGYLK